MKESKRNYECKEGEFPSRALLVNHRRFLYEFDKGLKDVKVFEEPILLGGDAILMQTLRIT